MEKQHVHVEERKVTGTDLIGEPEVSYARHSRRPRTQKARPNPNWEGRTEPYTRGELLDSIRESEEDVAAGRVRPLEDFLERMRKKYQL